MSLLPGATVIFDLCSNRFLPLVAVFDFGSHKPKSCFSLACEKYDVHLFGKKIDVKTGCLAVNSKPCLCEWIVCISIVAGGSPRCVWWMISDSLVVVWRLCDFTMCDFFWGGLEHIVWRCLQMSPALTQLDQALLPIPCSICQGSCELVWGLGLGLDGCSTLIFLVFKFGWWVFKHI